MSVAILVDAAILIKSVCPLNGDPVDFSETPA